MEKPRNQRTFVEDCLEVMDSWPAVSATDLGMAYRAWMDDATPSDEAVVRIVERELGTACVGVPTFGGSLWMIGAQLSPTGRDMVHEGLLMHLAIANRAR